MYYDSVLRLRAWPDPGRAARTDCRPVSGGRAVDTGRAGRSRGIGTDYRTRTVRQRPRSRRAAGRPAVDCPAGHQRLAPLDTPDAPGVDREGFFRLAALC